MSDHLFFLVLGGFLVIATLWFFFVTEPREQRRLRERSEREAAYRERQRDREARYGDAHARKRAELAVVIRREGADCMERICIMPTRRIAPGSPSSSWDLAHDHQAGGPSDYLGPAHKACNQGEALSRGATWDGAPSLAELLAQVGHVGNPYPSQHKPWSWEAERDAWAKLETESLKPRGPVVPRAPATSAEAPKDEPKKRKWAI